MYKLIIHHDIGIIDKEGKLEKESSGLGHVYLELLNNEERVVCGIVSGYGVSDSSYKEYIPHGEERLELARKYELQHPEEKILHSKAIEITEVQYLEAVVLLDEYEQYIGQKMPSEIYGLFGNNCAHFVNHIYRSIGLKGDYTRNYRTDELESINTILTKGYKVLGFYPGDKAFTVFGSSIEEVAKKYNVDISKVRKKELTQGIPDMEVAMMQEASDLISYEVLPNEKLLDHSDNDCEEEKANLEKEGAEVITNNPNQVINQQLEQLLSDPAYLKQYQEQSINDALDGLKLTEEVIPNITEQSLEYAKEQQEFLQNLIGIKDSSLELEKLKKAEQEAKNNTKTDKTQEQNIDDTDWLNNLISNTQNAMNDAFNNPDMQDFLKTLGGNNNFNFEDNA